MRKAIIIVAFAVTACLLQGCDFFRVLAGRPTSREIEEKRKAILLLDAVLPQNQTDTVQVDALTEPAVDTPAETLPATEPAKEPATNQEVKQEVKQPTTGSTGGIRVSTRKADTFADPKPAYRYYVMIGTFGSRDNAVRLSGKAGEAGYPVTLLPFANGMTTVAVCPTNDFGDVCAALEKLRKEAFCPKDACILKIE
ncbi:MAG: SPOR domain-containing protein [Bacteroidales bacterium]|nr:SPOR domain-containing protein [Bacteroidales bacterium]